MTILVPEGDHVVCKVEAVVLEDRRDARDAVQSAAVLDGDHLTYIVSCRRRWWHGAAPRPDAKQN